MNAAIGYLTRNLIYSFFKFGELEIGFIRAFMSLLSLNCSNHSKFLLFHNLRFYLYYYLLHYLSDNYK